MGIQALLKQSRYAAARLGRRAQKQTKQLRTYLGRVIPDLERQLTVVPAGVQELLERAKQIYRQHKQDSQKCYSVHAPEVECIAKGKAHQHYEFGSLVAVVTATFTNWIVAIEAHHDNPYDGATLKPALVQVECLTGVKPQRAIVDQGFRGRDHHPADVEVSICDKPKRTGSLQRLLKPRSAIEPVPRHTQQNHALGRNYFQVQQGERINALLVGCGFNLRKLIRFFVSTAVSVAQQAA